MKNVTGCVLALALSLNLFADVTYTTEALKTSEKGRLLTTTGKRGEVLVHKITRIDRGNKGTFSEYIEEFYVDGVSVLRFSEINGDYMVDCRNLGTGVMSLYYRGENQRPERLLVGRNEASAEVYIRTENGFHVAITDEDRKQFLTKLKPLPDESNRPNQALQHNDHDCHGSCSEQHAPRQP